MRRIIYRVIIGCHVLLAVTAMHSRAEADNYANHPQVLAFIDEMVAQHGFEREPLIHLFRDTQHNERVIKLITSPAEAKPWREYRPILVTEQRTKQGVAFMRENQETLVRAQQTYGVPAEIIVAIIGAETRYGRVTGSYPVVEALATLAFDYPRRADFFRKELKEYLILTREEEVDPRSLKGSYAGAMGYGQFMPSSYRAYAVDFDNDGHKDIWHNPVDAIGSVANYLYRHGWQQNGLVTEKAIPEGDGFEALLVKQRKDLVPKRTLAELIEKGFKPQSELPLQQPATAIHLEGAEGDEYWVGLHNFYVITRYNHSALYAMAVYQLSQEIAKRS